MQDPDYNEDDFDPTILILLLLTVGFLSSVFIVALHFILKFW